MDEYIAQHMRDRPAEQVWLVWNGAPRHDFDEVAQEVGLRPLGKAWVEIDADRAELLLAHILRTGLAYSDEHMPEQRARWLAREFVGSCGSFGTRYATNTGDVPGGHSWSWTPATDYTFDRGVVLLGTSRSACYWVADED
jgi:hypothetical protein